MNELEGWNTSTPTKASERRRTASIGERIRRVLLWLVVFQGAGHGLQERFPVQDPSENKPIPAKVAAERMLAKEVRALPNFREGESLIGTPFVVEVDGEMVRVLIEREEGGGLGFHLYTKGEQKFVSVINAFEAPPAKSWMESLKYAPLKPFDGTPYATLIDKVYWENGRVRFNPTQALGVVTDSASVNEGGIGAVIREALKLKEGTEEGAVTAAYVDVDIKCGLIPSSARDNKGRVPVAVFLKRIAK